METLVAGQKYKTLRYHLREDDAFICYGEALSMASAHKISAGDVYHCHKCQRKFCPRHWKGHVEHETMESLAR
jgi:hypothetical protein